jgi:hypothetical protein
MSTAREAESGTARRGAIAKRRRATVQMMVSTTDGEP